MENSYDILIKNLKKKGVCNQTLDMLYEYTGGKGQECYQENQTKYNNIERGLKLILNDIKKGIPYDIKKISTKIEKLLENNPDIKQKLYGSTLVQDIENHLNKKYNEKDLEKIILNEYDIILKEFQNEINSCIIIDDYIKEIDNIIKCNIKK